MRSIVIAALTLAALLAPGAATARRHGGAAYVFAVGMRNKPARAAFAVRGLPPRAAAEVIGEGRTVAVEKGGFADEFPPYGVRLYRIRQA